MIDYNKEKRYNMNVCEIERVCSLLETTSYVASEVKRLYYQLLYNGKTQGKDLITLIGALVYYICKRDENPVKMLEISNKLDKKRKLLFKMYKKIKKGKGWVPLLY